MNRRTEHEGTRIAVDVRALQDENYATKGIGQHASYIVGLLREIDGVHVAPYGDPLQRPLRKDHAPLFDVPMGGLQDMTGDV